MRFFVVIIFSFLVSFGGYAQQEVLFTTQTIHDSIDYPHHVLQFKKFECAIPLADTLKQAIVAFVKDSNSINPDYVLSNYNGLNPYNSNDIHVRVLFTHQSGKEITRYGFYYQDFVYSSDTAYWIAQGDAMFLVRFSTELPGSWVAHIQIESKKYGLLYTYNPMLFECVADSSSPGYIKAIKNERYFECSNTQKTFFINGLNIPHPKVIPIQSPLFKKNSVANFKDYTTYFKKAADAQCNFIRIALIGSYTSAPEFDALLNYTQRQSFMFEFDSIIEFAEHNNIYFQIIGDSFGPYIMGWPYNPYQTIPGIQTPLDVFDSEVAREYYKQRIRYIFSRWGYSPAFCMFEIINEIDQIEYQKQKLSRNTIFSWTSNMADYISNELQYPIMLTSNYAGFDKPPYVFALDNIDLVTVHYYGKSRNHDLQNLYGRIAIDWQTFEKPIIIDETGGHDSHGSFDRMSELIYKNRLFSTAFSGGAGTAIQYYWDVYLPKNKHVRQTPVWYNKIMFDYLSVLDSLHITNFNTLQFSPQRYPNYTQQNMYAVKSYDTIHSLVEQFALRDSAKQIVLGWVHNRSHYWVNQVTDSVSFPLDDDDTTVPISIDWKNPNPLIGEYVYIFDLLPQSTYQITWFSTLKTQETMQEITDCMSNFTTNSEGKSEKIYPPFNSQEFDFLFVVRKSN